MILISIGNVEEFTIDYKLKKYCYSNHYSVHNILN